MGMTQTTKVRIDTAAPVSAQFIGRTGVVKSQLGNAVVIDIDDHGPVILHKGWGTKRNPGNLTLTPMEG